MIVCYGLNNRDHILNFQNSFFKKNLLKNAIFNSNLSSENLGRNWSGFICQKANNQKLLVLLDVDDGSGGTPSDCKIVWSTLNNVIQSHQPKDYIILKSQINSNPEYNKYYPFKEDVYPLGVFSNNPDRVFDIKKNLRKNVYQKDIDVFYAGGLKHQKNRPYVWPKERDIRKWWSGASIRGYQKLIDIKNKRPDLKIQIFDHSLDPNTFYDLVMRSKICIDLPGVGLSSRKFYEYMVLEKCVLSLKQQLTPWPCEENIHYCSMGEDLDYDSMESKIDFLLGGNIIDDIEHNVSLIQDNLSLDYMISRVEKIIQTKLESLTDIPNIHY